MACGQWVWWDVCVAHPATTGGEGEGGESETETKEAVVLFVFGFEGWIIFGLEDIFADPIFVFILFWPRVYKGYM